MGFRTIRVLKWMFSNSNKETEFEAELNILSLVELKSIILNIGY